MFNRFKKKLGIGMLSESQTKNLVFKKIGNQIYTGPFAGLKIPEVLKSNMKLAEVLGLYEFALHKSFSSLINRQIKNIMVIGGHKGYYPAGLSNLLRPENMYVFEMDKNFFPMIESWIELNELKSYQILGEATPDLLENWKHKIDFLLMDCEGAEDILLDPEKYVWQKESDILVEIHHFYNNKILGNIVEKFTHTHDMEVIFDDINENVQIQNVLDGLGIYGYFRGQPIHRWILNSSNDRIITSGVFLYLKLKERNDS